MLKLNSGVPGMRVSRIVLVVAGLMACSVLMCAQSTPGTGGVQGFVSDEKGKPVAEAKVTITNKATAGVVERETSPTGVYASGTLQPGSYTVRVEAKGFEKQEISAQVQVGVAAGVNVTLLAAPPAKPAIATESPAVLLNAEQPNVQGVQAGRLIESLPISGRNPFDLAQLEPGVQYQDGSILFPGKNNLLFGSLLSRNGREARVTVDGVDISDEVLGATTQNIPASAIQEFSVSQSSLDISTDLSSTGTIAIATRTGSNGLHGEAFGSFSGNQGSASLPGLTKPTFQREQFGARAGGALSKDKLFWFLSAERTKQDFTAGEPLAFPFSGLNLPLSEPLREWQGDGRLDWQPHPDAHAFYRFSFDQSSQIAPFGAASSLQALRNEFHSPSHTLGYDFRRGEYLHSIRFEYLRFADGFFDTTATLPAGAENPIPGIGLNIGAVQGNCASSGGGAFCSGPSAVGPQTRFQSDIQIRYDGTLVRGSHIFHFGAGFNHVQADVWAAYATNPQVGTSSICLPGTSTFSCVTSADPTAYAADFVQLGNGLGYSTSKSAFGQSGGGLGADNRFAAYGGDNWKVNRTLTLTYGLHYVRDTGRSDAGLGPQQAFNLWQPGLGAGVRNPNTNFAPQFGFAWDSGGTGTTVIRGGAGLYYGNTLWDYALLDNPVRAKTGNYRYTPEVCVNGTPSLFMWPTNPGPVGSAVAGGAGVAVAGNNLVQPTFCGGTISSVAPQILALSSAFQAAAAANGSGGANPSFIQNSLSAANASGYDVFDPDFRQARSWQMNLGFQRRIQPGTVLSADYVRSVGLHYLIGIDRNHSGAARSYNGGYAAAARDAAQLANGCPAGLGQVNCMLTVLGQAGTQAAYSQAGLDSNSAVMGGGPCSFCAFPGVTPDGQNNTGIGAGNGTLGTLDTLEPVGRSVYSGVQVKLVHSVQRPLRLVKTANLQLAYTYSKFKSQSADQDFINLATNNDNPLQYTGPGAMDRRHQVSFGGSFDLPFSARVSILGHFFSPLAQTLRLPELTNGGEIFASDWLGTGLGSGAPPEPVPGTQIGDFMRGEDIHELQSVISKYNTHYAGSLTPAGHCLVGDSACPGTAPIPIFTVADMNNLGWVMPQLASVPVNALNVPWLKTLDLKASWPVRIRDRFTIEPSASVFNVFNFANSFMPGNLPVASLLPGGPNNTLAPNSIGGVTGASVAPFRAGFQSGTYSLGAPRQLWFGLRIEF